MMMQISKKLALALAVVAIMASASPASAQGKKKQVEQKVEERSYLMPYAATILGIGIGLAAVLMPSNRKTEVKIEEEE
jgi:hypothetical protein